MVPRAEVVAHWPVAALLCPLVFAAIGPVTVTMLPVALFVILAQLPLTMAHQVEEHANDRFRSFINARFGAGVLSAEAVAVINLPGVWGVMLLGFALAAFAGPGWGLVAPYLSLVKALIHVAAFVALRAYNPGVVSAVVLLLPGGALGLFLVPGTVLQHALAALVVLAIHAAIVVHVKMRAASLGAAALRTA
jgi:hypothetical protein